MLFLLNNVQIQAYLNPKFYHEGSIQSLLLQNIAVCVFHEQNL